ncbi:ribonuclease E inhibitor RraB [Jannaschia sp. M317]|uniref:ribonuclease E inhibitor RraB n=1 Tax=Jannaschia sp. M317 TaxID=2867011 RepID=UPI0021A33226|nr:ribonuclease E inhibitor RraB [Jannaschia sp. M317]UWQ17511.1 ribonuclease E inhibitor RraB [Jannaschia sp. M317]
MTPHDPEAQRAATRAQWAEITAQTKPPARAMIDLHFEAAEGADATEFMGWLEDEGFDLEHFPADEDEPETIEAQTGEMALTLDAVLAEEARTTEAALRFGFRPTGWGFIGL